LDVIWGQCYTSKVSYIPVVRLYLFVAANAYKHIEGVVSNSRVYFTSHVPSNTAGLGPEPLRLRRILDMVSSSHFDTGCTVASFFLVSVLSLILVNLYLL